MQLSKQIYRGLTSKGAYNGFLARPEVRSPFSHK